MKSEHENERVYLNTDVPAV